MRKRHVVLTSAVVIGSLAVAGPAAALEADSPYEIAIEAPADDAIDVEPTAIPAVIGVATAVVRGFTAAKAPQQVGQVTRAASVINAFGATPKLGTGSHAKSLDVIFDH